MHTQYAGIFSNSLQHVLHSFTSRKIVGTDMELPSRAAALRDISVEIRMFGDIDGHVRMSMNAVTGKALTSEMLGGAEIDHVDEIVISAVSELCNMIMGHACTALSEHAAIVDITPPVVKLEGDALTDPGRVDTAHVCIILENLGHIELGIAV